ncbi:TRAP transporter large permease [Leisingera sp. ANG59]|uniref:TRAP transporter large permease n=1 Tax=Leisingera sp. ANG59 TaxID=2675221 RepID=UPI0015732946|nr:TRAP transporter large permease [Leisingera sp. ANG59]NSY39352.1 TRAP transporter large permease subunit [Leisingera sp. ANG59]
MSSFDLGLISFPILMVFLFLRMPIGIAMFTVGFVGNWIVMGTPLAILNQLKSLTVTTFSSYSLSIVPLFLLMGQFATISGMSAALFKSAEQWLGHRKGGVGMAAIGACAGFGAICGSSMATAATMGQVALPELRKYGYANGLAAGTLAAGGTLGVLIPPSVVLVIYAILAEQNIAKLFVAAFIPGLMAAAGYMIAIAIYVRLYPDSATRGPRANYVDRLRGLGPVLPVIAVFVVVVGGIYAGIFTPTEAASVGAAATALLAVINGTLSFRALRTSLEATAKSTAMIFMIVIGASVFNNFLSLAQVPQNVADYAVTLAVSPWLILVVVLLLYLIFGCLMDSLSMILLTIPIIYPALSQLDFGLQGDDFGLWFGILVLVVVEVGLITPPVGLNLFVIKSMSKEITLRETFIGVTPFVISDILRVVLLTALPFLSLWLVHLIY